MIPKDQTGAIVELWKEVLKTNEVELDRGFAEQGGTSLAANQFVARLGKQFGVRVPVVRIFEYPTLRQLLKYLVADTAPPRATGTAAAPPGAPIRESASAAAQVSAAAAAATAPAADEVRPHHDIALVGMSCRLPGARNVQEFWDNLLAGRDSITRFDDATLSPTVPAELRNDPRYVRAAGLIDDPFGMDAEFFGIKPAEAALIDPQQRVLLELSWQALEHAGEALHSAGARVAVYAGVEDNTYYKAEIGPFPAAERRAGRFSIMTGNEKDYVAMRIAHKLNLKGPAVSVSTACSTSLVAIVMACKSLRAGDCDLALAGGASVHFPTPEGYYYQEGGVFSSDGSTRPFDAHAQGTNFTDGAGIVVLKRAEDALRDGNTIFALIKGGAINSDGGDKVSFSAPSVSGQAACIREALADADVDAGTLQYVEAHGTATPVGDPIEVEALRQAFASRAEPKRLQYCGIGSVKSNIGHTTAAAGVASLIKTALSLRQALIPATVHFQSPNPGLELENSPFYVVGKTTQWPRGKTRRRAGISSFGIGGTNTHVIVEEAPRAPAPPPAAPARSFDLWPVAARSTAARDQLLEALKGERFAVRDVAHTLVTGRARLPVRGARIRFADPPLEDVLVQATGPALENPRLALLFPGQGAQYIGMGRSLYQSMPEFRAAFSEVCGLLSQHMGLDFQAFIFDPANQETLENTRYTQPALFAIEVSLGRTLLGFGLQPDFMIGHSIGEFAAAHLAGVFSLEDAVRLITARGRLMAELPRGRMLSARAALDAVKAAAGEAVDVASINSPVHSVLAGDFDTIARVQARLESAGIPCRALHTSHAFHSAMMDPVVAPFLEVARSVQYRAPRMSIISTVTGALLDAGQATDPAYWANHLRTTVSFSPAVFKALELGANVFLEAGPRTTLSSLAVQHFAAAPQGKVDAVAIAMLSDTSEPEAELGGFAAALARLWCAGIELPWEQIWSGGRKVPLQATYPFNRKRFRFSEGRAPEVPALASVAAAGAAAAQPAATHAATSQAAAPLAVAAAASQAASGAAMAPRADAQTLLVEELGRMLSEYSGLSVNSQQATFVELGLDSLLLMQIGVQMGKNYGVSVALRELMEKFNTLTALASHILATAPPEKIAHLSVSVAAPLPAPPLAQAQAQPAAVAAAAMPSAAAPAALVQGVSSEEAAALRQQLNLLQALVTEHQRHLEKLVPPSGNGLASGANGASADAPASPATAAAAPLLRARREQPPAAGAFRGGNGGPSRWVAYNEAQRRYVFVDR